MIINSFNTENLRKFAIYLINHKNKTNTSVKYFFTLKWRIIIKDFKYKIRKILKICYLINNLASAINSTINHLFNTIEEINLIKIFKITTIMKKNSSLN